MRQGLVSLNPTNGVVNFSFWFRSPFNESVNAMEPIVVDDLILISGAYYKIGSVLLKVNGGASPLPRAGSTSLSPSDGERAGVRGASTDGTAGLPDRPVRVALEEIWRSTVLELHWSTPVYHDGFLYAFSGRNEPDARFRCVEFKTGKLMWDRDEKWQSHSSPTPDVYGRAPVSWRWQADRSRRRWIARLFKLNPQQPEEVSRFQVIAIALPLLGRADSVKKTPLFEKRGLLAVLKCRQPLIVTTLLVLVLDLVPIHALNETRPLHIFM